MGETQSAYGNALKLLQDHWAECQDAGVQCDQIKEWRARGNEACYRRYKDFMACWDALTAAGFSPRDTGDDIFEQISNASLAAWYAMTDDFIETKFPYKRVKTGKTG